MCLTVKLYQKPRKAKTDIEVYKLVEENDGNLVSFFQETPVKLGETYESELIKVGCSIHIGLHSYAALDNAIDDAGLSSHTTHVVKCIIPKGALYYKGLFASDIAYASNKIIYTKEILNTRN